MADIHVCNQFLKLVEHQCSAASTHFMGGIQTLQSLFVKPDCRTAGLPDLRDLLQVAGNSNFGSSFKYRAGNHHVLQIIVHVCL